MASESFRLYSNKKLLGHHIICYRIIHKYIHDLTVSTYKSVLQILHQLKIKTFHSISGYKFHLINQFCKLK